MKKIFRLSAVILLLFMVTGCWDQKIYENLGFMLSVGLDTGKEGKVLVTYSIPVISERGESSGGSPGGAGGEKKTELVVEEAYTTRQARDKGRESSDKNLEAGKTQNVLIGRELAEKGIAQYLEIFERVLDNPTQASVVIVDGNAHNFICKGVNLKDKPRLAMYLNHLLDANSKSGYCPDETLAKYNIDNNIPGLDPLVPLVKLEENDLKVMGTALVHNDRMTGRITTEETAYLNVLMGKKKSSELTIVLPPEIEAPKKAITVYAQSTKSKSNIQFQGNIPKIQVAVRLKLIVDEYKWDNLADKSKTTQLENAISENIKMSLESVFKKLQDANCDALGIGDRIRAKYNDYWKSIGEKQGWESIYPKVILDAKVSADIIRYGSIR